MGNDDFEKVNTFTYYTYNAYIWNVPSRSRTIKRTATKQSNYKRIPDKNVDLNVFKRKLLPKAKKRKNEGCRKIFTMKNMSISIKCYIFGKLFPIFLHNHRRDRCILACGILYFLHPLSHHAVKVT